MKKIMIIIGLAIIAISMNGCNTPINTQDPSGIYTGTLPCADCPGIQARVDLNSDMTYTLQTLYIDRSDEIFTQSGTFKWNAGNNTIAFDDPLLGECLLEGNVLYILVDGKRDTGPNAENYMLAKIDQDLVEKYWKLLELYGNPIASANGSKEAHIIFHIEGNRFSGDAGCNRMTGSYQVRDNSRIAFSQTIATRMMCLDMDTETKFLEVLEAAESYSILGDTLTLSGTQTVPMARFVAVYLR